MRYRLKDHETLFYTCQLFLRYKREIFILGVLGFLKTTRSFPKISEEVRSLPKKSEVCRRRARSQCFSLQKSEIGRKISLFIHFTHGFRSLRGSELTYFWKLCQARRQQLTFFNQAWEIDPQAWAGVRSQAWDSRLRRESWQVYLRAAFRLVVNLALVPPAIFFRVRGWRRFSLWSFCRFGKKSSSGVKLSTITVSRWIANPIMHREQ